MDSANRSTAGARRAPDIGVVSRNDFGHVLDALYQRRGADRQRQPGALVLPDVVPAELRRKLVFDRFEQELTFKTVPPLPCALIEDVARRHLDNADDDFVLEALVL